jgi:hypothetical protein
VQELLIMSTIRKGSTICGLKLCLGFDLPYPPKTNIQALIFLAGFGCCKEEVVEKKTD